MSARCCSRINIASEAAVRVSACRCSRLSMLISDPPLRTGTSLQPAVHGTGDAALPHIPARAVTRAQPRDADEDDDASVGELLPM